MAAAMSRATSRRGRLLGLAAVLCATNAVMDGLVTSTFVPAPGRADAGVRAAVATASASLLLPQAALAKGGVWGPLEGKASSLVHPFSMAVLFLATCYTGYLGWQWRSLRTVGADLSALKKKVPEHKEGEELSPAVKALQAEIEELTAQRKELQDGKFKDRHSQISALLLGGGIFFTVYGVFNTWFRAEKLFPGPHLFAGAAICVIWAMAAACVPWMEKGNETARVAHIGLNVICASLFAWQLFTGFEIFLKVIDLSIPWF